MNIIVFIDYSSRIILAIRGKNTLIVLRTRTRRGRAAMYVYGMSIYTAYKQ